MTMTTTTTHAEENAEGHAQDIVEAWLAYSKLANGAESAEYDGETYTDTDTLCDHVRESALCVEVRGGWHVPGDDDPPQEFAILLSTGGPACRIWGSVNSCLPPVMQCQDWGTPWTEYRPQVADWCEAVLWFCELFYFGGE